ncbi:MAG: hypothetical protein LBN37_03665 [Bacteroidales bacterium]|jgi:hypothetical protein|nr:hypothetical protein [Bacteroidales bacterium]
MNVPKLLICSVSLIAVSATAYLLACGWFIDEDNAYTSYFRKDIPPAHHNYYFSYLNYYDNAIEQQTDKQQNIAEWKHYLSGKIADKDAEQVVYDIPLAELKEICACSTTGQWKKISPAWLSNSMMNRIVQRKDISALNYLLYSRICEQQAGRRSDDWQSVGFDANVQDSLLTVGLKHYAASKSEFLRLRYAFQVVRMAFYLDRKADCADYYRKLMCESVETKALAKRWALSFYSGAIESDAEALYGYSKVFEQCPRYSQAAMTSFRWRISRTDTTQLLALCGDDVEKSVVHAMIGFTCFHPTLEPLINVYDLNPGSPYLETLLIREISKIEAGLTGYDADRKDDMLFHARQLQELAIHYAGLNAVRRPALWHTAAAYLAFLSGNHETASLLVDIAEQEQEHPDKKVSEQLMAVKLLVETDISTFDADTEARILPSLEWLLANVQDSTAPESRDFFNRTVAHYFTEKLPAVYLNIHQPVKAALCTGIAIRYSDFAGENIYELNDFAFLDKNADIPQLERMLKQLAAPETLSAFDAFLYRHCRQSESAISELIGTKYLRRLQFQKAENYFKGLSDASPLFHLGNNPFALPAAFAKPAAGLNVEKMTFQSKLSFAGEMAALQNRIQQGTSTPEDLFRYACGLFQMTTFGNSWQLLSYRWTSADRNQWEKAQPTDELYHYYHLGTAREYFMRAFEASRNKELKAQSLFMASFCYQLTLSEELYAWQNGKYAPTGSYFLQNPYFSQLKRQYAKTDFYKDAVTRCSYLSDFVKR